MFFKNYLHEIEVALICLLDVDCLYKNPLIPRANTRFVLNIFNLSSEVYIDSTYNSQSISIYKICSSNLLASPRSIYHL